MNFGILGELDVTDGGAGVSVRGTRRRGLLGRLLVSANRVVPASVLLHDVWDGAPPRALSTLASHVFMLRTMLDPDRIDTRGDGYLLRLEPGELDAQAFEADLAQGRDALAHADAHAGVAALERGLARWRGPALADLSAMRWAQPEASRLDELRRTALESLLDARLHLGDNEHVVVLAESAVYDEPLRERRWATLIRALYRSGRQADALRAYQRVRTLLAAELGITPSADLVALEGAVLRHDPTLDRITPESATSDINPEVTTSPHPGRVVSLPARPNPLIGRTQALTELVALLETHRLITVTGVGGIGKTRLAIEAARATSTGVQLTVFVDLSAVTDPTQVIPVAVTALQVPVRAGTDDHDAIVAHLHQRPALVVIDNAEHLLDAVADLTETLLARCPTCRVLITSREPLGTSDEQVWRIQPLDTTASLTLLAERLGGHIDPHHGRELCVHLDGLPLAIELAAAGCRALGITNIIDDLDHRLHTLTAPRRPHRHTTLHATLQWSHALLDEPEQQLLRRLAVFTGGFTLHAVEGICEPIATGAPTRPVLAALVDKSLVVFDHEQQRHRLLDTIRLFAQQQLDSAGETATLRNAHARWFIDELTRQPWVDHTTLLPFTPDAPNLLAAADWLTTNHRHRDLVVLLTRSAGIWIGLLQEHHIATRAHHAYQHCQPELSAFDDAIACAFFGLALRPGSRWRQRGIDVDPDLACRPARSNPVALTLSSAHTDPHRTIETVRALRALPGGLDPDMTLLTRVAESDAWYRLGDLDRAEAAYTEMIDDQSSVFWCGPMMALAAMRTVNGNLDGADEILHRVDHHPHRDLRLGTILRTAVQTQLLTAKGDLTAAAAGLRHTETIRDTYPNNYPAVDHHWFETAAYLAAARGQLHHAARLTHAAHATLGGGETVPYITTHLQHRYAQHPTWRAALQQPPTLEQARNLARRTAQHI